MNHFPECGSPGTLPSVSQRTIPVSVPAVSRRARASRSLLTAAFAAVVVGLVPAGAQAAARVEKVEIPSSKGYVDLSATKLNRPAKSLTATVVLPEGYDAEPQREWPVLYLLAGVGDTSDAYVDPKKGNVLKVAAGFPGIIVTPESGRGYFTDWWRGGKRTGSQWERYMLEELIPFVEDRYRLAPGRNNRAIGGVSMGGFGGTLLSGQLPSYFGNAISVSGMLNAQSPEVVNVLPIDMGAPYTRVWGRPTGDYALGHNPVEMTINNANTRLWLSSGNGTPSNRFPFSFAAWTSGALAEQATRAHTLRFSARAKRDGADVTVFGYQGVHDWPYWRAAMPAMFSKWKPFTAASAPDPTSWKYKTIAPRGNVWGLGYKFDEAPTKLAIFERDGNVISGNGSGIVTFTPGAAFDDASGNGSRPDCAFTVTLPFEQTLPEGCGFDGTPAATR